VLREVEEPLFRVVLDYAQATRAAPRTFSASTAAPLRKKLKQFGLAGS